MQAPLSRMQVNLQEAVARYAEDNLLVVRVFLKDPYYQKMVRDRTMSGNSFFGSAGGWLGLCCGLSVISMLEIGYHTSFSSSLFAKGGRCPMRIISN